MDDFDRKGLEQLDRDAIEIERLHVERERLRLQRIQLALSIQQAAMQRSAYRRSNRSWYDRLEGALLDW